MTDAESRRSVTPRFSLLNLLALTALIALGTAVGLAYRQNRSMLQQRDELLALSSRLQLEQVDELASAEMPRVADGFYSWNVYVPTGKDYELRLGMGAVFETGIPPIVGSVPIPAGRHRVTLHTGDSPSEEFRYVVYIDGKQVIDKTMGGDWIPDGWSSASGMGWPRESSFSPAPMQLAAQIYRPKLDFGRGNYFNGQSDSYVTGNGYRLWIDLSDRTYPPASPFMGFASDHIYQGIGLRDGLRFRPSSRPPYEWTFTRPDLDTSDPVLRVSAEFFSNDGAILTNQTSSFQSWQLRNDALGESALSWQADPNQSVYSAFLQARLKTGDVPQPVVELRWDADRPDEVGLRMAETPANDRISRWRLRILDGSKHLWREVQIGDREIEADEVIESDAFERSDGAVKLDLGNSTTTDTHLQWQTKEVLPLQIVERRQNQYQGMGLYRGLPLTCGIEIPAALKPDLAVRVAEEVPNAPGNAFPGGPVFEEIQIELEAVSHDWIWLQAKARK